MFEMNRRTFLQSLAGAAAAPVPKIAAQGRPGLRLGFDSYVLRGYGWKAAQFLEYAAKLKLDSVHLSDLSDFESLEPAYLAKVREHAQRLGLSIDGGISSLCPSSGNYHKEYGDPAEYVLRGLRTAKAVGANVMRTFIGGGAERNNLQLHIENTLKVLKAVRSQALDLGVKIAIENHGDLQAWEMRELIETAGPDFVGSCLDSGNAVSAIENPLVTIETPAPYVLTTHIRDSAVYEHPRGAVMQWVALGEGSVEFATFFEKFRVLCPKAVVQLEILTGNPPRVLPYLEQDFWKVYSKARASEFARFVELAKRGRPFMGTMMTAPSAGRPAEYTAAMKEQQRIDLERSFEYARNVLKVGR
jgi:sugar phosphate isomerase/epimerase